MHFLLVTSHLLSSDLYIQSMTIRVDECVIRIHLDIQIITHSGFKCLHSSLVLLGFFFLLLVSPPSF